MKKIVIILGSKSDLTQVESGLKLLSDLKISYDLKILSAHRNPVQLKQYVGTLTAKGIKVVIAAAGLSAALPGVVASHVTLPVIGVPLYSRAFRGIDSLLSILQMPKGVPVGTMTVGSSGMVNAVLFAVRILALSEPVLLRKLTQYKKKTLKKK